MLHKEITDLIIKSFYKVYNTHGYGFLEKVYENSMVLELKNHGLKCETQKAISVFYDGVIVGNYFADIIVENKVILELKATEALREEHEAQLINYLRATNIEVGLLINFGKEAEFVRKVFSNSRKKR